MYQQQHHEMHLKSAHPSGAEEWYCPACHRRLIIYWPPGGETITLRQGDECIVVHRRAQNQGAMTRITIESDDEVVVHIGYDAGFGPLPDSENTIGDFSYPKRLASWSEWLEDIDMDFGD